MFCPKCRAEYKPGREKCADCGAVLVDKLPNEAEASTEFVEVLATFNAGDIAMVESLLSETDIPYYFHGENFARVRPLIEPARLMVAKDRADEVRELLKDLRLSYRSIDFSGRNAEDEKE
jgi:hypothetical protein